MSKLLTSVFAALLMITTSAFAAEPAINTLEKKGLLGYKASEVAIRGTDTVAYWTESKPVAGSDEFSTEWMGATWKFASQENLDLFTANPEKYAPQYGGYCAFGVAKGALVKIEPENWSIVDDKLYLNYDDGVQEKWEKDIPGFIKAADDSFQSLLSGS